MLMLRNILRQNKTLERYSLSKSRCLILALMIPLLAAGFQTTAYAGNKLTVHRTSSAVLLDGREISFNAYIINDSNYCKLRDVAFVFNNTARQFSVSWDNDTKTIALENGKPYKADGGEMTAPPETAQGEVSNVTVTVNGKPTVLTAYLIGNYNYVKLRELAEKLNFGLIWNSATNAIELNSNEDYVPETSNPYSAYNSVKNDAVKYLKARLAENCPIASYETSDIYLQSTAFTYDNAVAAMAFISNGNKAEAKQILDAFVKGIANDRYKSDRVRNAYRKGDPTVLPGWWTGSWGEDAYQVGTNVGNTSYLAMAMLQYDRRWGSDEYLDTVKLVMDWVLNNCTDESAGFMYGYEGWPENGPVPLHTYKSTEHNIDAYAVFKQLYKVTGESKYDTAAQSALKFINSMYNNYSKYFWIGTVDDGVTPNKDDFVLDAQVWTVLAAADEISDLPAVLNTAVSMETKEGGYPFNKANYNGGYWCEGTAFTALMLRTQGMDDKALTALNALKNVQLPSGCLPAATVKELPTGLGWYYGTDPHITPTAWLVLAVNNFNPYSFN